MEKEDNITIPKMRQLTLVCEEELDKVLSLSLSSDEEERNDLVEEMAKEMSPEEQNKVRSKMVEDMISSLTTEDLIEEPDEELNKLARESVGNIFNRCTYPIHDQEYFDIKMKPAELEFFMRTRFDLKNMKGISYEEVQKLKMLGISFFQDRIRGGFYKGFLNIILCLTCNMILDCWPARQKVVFWAPSKHCSFCVKVSRRMTGLDNIQYGRRKTANSKWYHYKIL